MQALQANSEDLVLYIFLFCFSFFYDNLSAMKKLFWLLISFVFQPMLFAQDVSVDNIFSSLSHDNVVKGDFLMEKSLASIKRPLKSSGKFIFSPEGILWQTLRPFPSSTAVTKNSIIQTLPDGSKSVTDGSSNEVFKSVAGAVSSVFSGNQAALEDYFLIDSFSSSSSAWRMALVPKDSTISSVIKKIELAGSFEPSSACASLDTIRIIQGENEFTSYTLSSKEYRQELTDEEKAFFK